MVQYRKSKSAQPNIPMQLAKLFLCLFLLGFILSLVTGNLAVGFGIVGGIFVAVLVAWFVLLISRRRQGQ